MQSSHISKILNPRHNILVTIKLGLEMETNLLAFTFIGHADGHGNDSSSNLRALVLSEIGPSSDVHGRGSKMWKEMYTCAILEWISVMHTEI